MDVPNPEKTHKMWEYTHPKEAESPGKRSIGPDPVEQFKKRLEEVKRNPPKQRRTRPLPSEPFGGSVDKRLVDMGDGPGSGVAAFGFGIMLLVSLFPYIAGALLFMLVCSMPSLIRRGLKAIERGIQRIAILFKK